MDQRLSQAVSPTEVRSFKKSRAYYFADSAVRPMSAIIGGYRAKPGRIMGHAGAFAALGEADAAEKFKVLQNAGVTMVDHPEKFGPVMHQLLSATRRDLNRAVSSN